MPRSRRAGATPRQLSIDSTSMRYFARSREEDPEYATANGCVIDVVQESDGVGSVIGRYQRNYDRFFNTFAAFKRNGRNYALYSPDYTCTRIMSLPDCKDASGETMDGDGFLPGGLLCSRRISRGGSCGTVRVHLRMPLAASSSPVPWTSRRSRRGSSPAPTYSSGA